jgi:hypothetical protein
MAAKSKRFLPREIIPAAATGQFTATVLAVFIAVMVINLGAAWYLRRYTPNIGYLLIRAKWAALQSLTKPLALLILGDSSGNSSVDPGLFTDTLKVDTYNFCTIGNTLAVNDALMLGAYIERFGPPKTVVIVHAYDVWFRDVDPTVLAHIPGSWWQCEPQTDLTVRQKGKIFLNRYVPLYAENTSLGEVILNPSLWFRSALQLSADGFMPIDRTDSAWVIKDLAEHQRFVRGSRPVISAANRKALAFICEQADKYRFDVFLFPGPVYSVLWEDSAYQAYYQGLCAGIDAVIGGSARVHNLIRDPMTFDIDQMQSVDHITTSATPRYTAWLARQIRSLAAAPETP